MREVPSIPVGLEPKLRNLLSAIRESLNSAITNINANSEGLNGIRQWIMPAIEANNDLTIFSQAQINAALESATGADGAAGIAARAVSLTTPNQSFTYDTNGANPSPATSVITATVFNTVGVVYYEFFLNDVSTGTATTSNTYTYTPKSTFTGMPDKLEVQIREDGLDGAIEARDQMTMIGLKAGSHGITVMLSNEAHTLPRSIAGVVTYTGSGTKINVWEGTTALTEDSSSPYANSTFRVTTAATGITPGSITGTGTTTLTYGDANSMTTSPAKIDFTIIAKRQDGTEITISKQQSLSYSQAGATGAGGDAVDIVFVRAASQPATPTASSGTPTAPIIWYTDVASVPVSANPLWASTGFKASALANYTWDTPVRVEGASVAEVTVFTRGVPTSTPTGGTYTFSNPPVLVVPTSTGATWYTSIPSGTTAVYTSRAVVSTSAGNTSAVAITGWTTPVISFQNGADAVLSDLSNDNHTVPTDSSGSNGNFTGCATTMSVFIGSSDDSANWTYAVTKSTGVTCTEAITSRTQTVTAMTTDTGTVTIVASRSGYANQTQVFSISKAKSGVAYQINLSNNSVRKSAAGVLSPTTLILTASKLDISGVTAYTGRFKIYLNGSATATYTSAADEASKAYTVTATDTTIKCELYLAGGTTTLVDAETVLVVADGATGATGTSVYTGTIYQQITTATAPSGGSYNFNTGVLTAPASWTTTPPTTTTTPTWACDYTFSTNTPTTAVTAGTWTNLHIDMVKGADGINGTRTAVLDLYQWSSSVPTLFPSGTSTYTWATGQFTNPATLNSWTATPASPTAGQVLYVCHAFFADSLTTATSTVTWSTTVAIPSGSAGNNGNAAPIFSINNSAVTFAKGIDNVILPATLALTTSVSNVTTPTYQWYKSTDGGSTYTTIASATASSYTITSATDYASVTAITYKCIVTGTINGVASQTLNDAITIPLLSDSKSAVSVVLSNENISFPALVTGYTGITFTGGNCDVTAYIGTTQLIPTTIAPIATYIPAANVTLTTGNYAASYVEATGTLTCTKPILTITAIDTALDVITIASNGFNFFSPIRYTYTGAGATIGGLVNNTNHFAVPYNSNSFYVTVGTTLTSAGSFVVGKKYAFYVLGTTTQAQWNTITGVASSNHTYGEVFTCANAGVGMGTGTAFELADFSTSSLVAGNVYSIYDMDWNSGLVSTTSFTSGAKLTFMATAGSSAMLGLNTDPATNANYNSIDYAIYVAGPTIYIFESGVNKATVGTYTSTDLFTILYNNDTVSYYKNGIRLYSTDVAKDLTLYVDSSLIYPNTVSATSISNIGFSAYVGPAANTFTYDVLSTNLGTSVMDGTVSGSTFAIPAPTNITAETAYADVLITPIDAAKNPLATITKRINYSLSRAGTNGVNGSNGDSVDIVFVRSATVPATPTASTGTPTAPITWYTSVTAANTAGGIVNPLYSSTGLKTASVGNYTWDAPVRIDGTAVAEVTVFVRSATVPATPTTGGTYTFSATPIVVAPTAPIAWSTSVPSGTNPVYTSRAVVSTSSNNTAAVAISGWSTPVISLQNGADGQRVGFLELYRWSAAAPTTYPSGTSTYTWSTGTFTAPATLNGWALVPATAVAGQSLWGISATISNTSTTATDTATWSSTSPYVVGYAGGNGVSINVVELYQQAASPPALPTGTSYDFSTDTLSGTLGSWVRTMPASSTVPTYITVCTFTVTAPTTSQTRTVWSAAVIAAQNGGTGPTGPTGARATFTTYAAVASAAWNDATAYAAITAMTGSGGVLLVGDEVTLCYPNTTAPTWVLTKYVTAVGNPGTWAVRGQVIDGNLLVTGTLSAASLKTSNLTAANAISVVNASNVVRAKFGNLGTTYGIQGWDSATPARSVFKLDENGLDAKITQSTIKLFGGSYHNRIILEGDYTFTVLGTAVQTAILPISVFSAGTFRLKAQITGYWENDVGNASHAMWREMSMGIYFRNSTQTSISMGVVAESGDTTATVSWPITRATLQVNATTEQPELKLTSFPGTAGIYGYTSYSYIIWAIDNVAYPFEVF